MKTVKKTRSELYVASEENVESDTNNLPLSLADGLNTNSTCFFPEEVLEILFENLSKPEDIHNVINSCPQFRRILKPRRTADLFGMVLPLISTQLRTYDLVTCRLVCKSWKSAVRSLLHNHPSVRPYDPKNDNLRNPLSNLHREVIDHLQLSLYPLHLETPLNIVELGRNMQNHPGNPFVHEMVVAFTETFNITSRYWQQTFRFLQSYGRYITHFKMNCSDYNNCFVQFYKIMQRCLKLLPNLTTLELGYENEYEVHEAHNRHEDDNKTILQKVINKFDLPPLPKLDTLIMAVLETCKSRYQRMILESLLRNYGGQLKKIHVTPVVWCARFIQLNDLRHSLTELHIVPNESKTPFVVKLLWAFKGYSILRKVSFCFCAVDDINIPKLMDALNGLSSVQYLKFHDFGGNPVFGSNLSNSIGFEGDNMVQLPNVKTLELVSRVQDELLYATVLTYFPALEYFKIDNYKPPSTDGLDVTTNSLFEVVKGLRTRTFYESCIWKRLPFLKEVICSDKSLFLWKEIVKRQPIRDFYDPSEYVRFTRDQYESVKRN